MSTINRINEVMSDISKQGIGKNQRNNFDNYKFRGIDDIYNTLAPILSKRGVVILPSVEVIDTSERTSDKGKSLFYKTVTVAYRIMSEDDDGFVCRMFGEAMDRSDKATNKAMSAAYKSLCFQLFCIPIEGEDSESSSHVVVPKNSNPIQVMLQEHIAHIRSLKTDVDIAKYLKENKVDGISGAQSAWLDKEIKKHTETLCPSQDASLLTDDHTGQNASSGGAK